MASVQVIWTTNKGGNTGMGGPLALVVLQAKTPLEGQESVLEKRASLPLLERWCADNRFIEHDCELVR
jgi:hypothetical protein